MTTGAEEQVKQTGTAAKWTAVAVLVQAAVVASVGSPQEVMASPAFAAAFGAVHQNAA